MGSYSQEEYFYKLDNIILSSCQVLRKLFQTRWKKETGKTWQQTEEQGQQFIDGLGNTIYKKAQKPQKDKILKGCLQDWDLTLLSMILQNFGNPEDYTLENEAVRSLTRLRNDLAHHSTKKLQKEEFHEKLKLFRASLNTLQVSDEVIDKIVEKAGLTSSLAALDATKKLFKKASKLVESEQFEKAIIYFDEATTLPSLLPVYLSVAFEKRSDCYLKLAHQKKQNQNLSDADKCCEQALLDAKEALQLNDSSWKAHHLLAQCHRWQNNVDKAVKHYQTALAISPVQSQSLVKNELDSCKALAGWRNRDETTDPRNLPLTLTEALGLLEEETGNRLTEEQFITIKRDVEGKAIKGQEFVFQGHQYANGWSVPRSDEEAVRFFTKAAKVKNAEGIYYLGLSYRHGRGVKQDLKKAYKLFLEAAEMPSDFPLPTLLNSSRKNVGVVSAQHNVGLFYEYGIVVEQDYCEAIRWYKKATENGNGTSAYNLGLMYAFGKGVPKSLKTAELYWNQGLIFEEPKAAEKLVHYYLQQLEPERARAAFETGRKLESVELNGISEEEFNNLVQPVIARRQKFEKDVTTFEKQNNLDIKGITFLERVQRCNFAKDENIAKLFQDMKTSNQNWGGQIKQMKFSDFMEVERLARQGSITAARVMKTSRANFELFRFLDQLQMEELRDETTKPVLNLLYDYLTLQFGTGVPMCLPSSDSMTKLKTVTAKLLREKCDLKKSEDDMKIRFCHAYLNRASAKESGDMSIMKILEEGIKKYPENLNYYLLLTHLYGLIGDHKSGLYYAAEGLQKVGDKDINMLLLFAKASHLHMLPDNPDWKESIKTYKLFLSKAPPDHRNLPDAYYSIAILQRFDEEGGRDSALAKMEHYYNLGMESEGQMLPCYLPYECGNKMGVELLIRIAKAAKDPRSSSSSSSLPLKTKEFGEGNPPSQVELKSTNILEKKQYLTSPVRKRLILEHRNYLNLFAKQKKQNMVYFTRSISPKLSQTTPKRMSKVKRITLKEMNPTQDTIYQDTMIDFTIVEDPCFDFNPNAAHLVVEDENGDLSRLYIFKIDKNEEDWEEKLGFGTVITILNPYMRIGGVDGANGIRNDEPACVIYLGKIENMCRFCGGENASHVCASCKRAKYCGRECQKLDWKLMKHQLICRI
ncbi:unnamed protein product [Orchesella dallaii]|uniref:MYND-type domain-containing protein n=1 Tax=Orchesella dallaii TaxID=48710 RepID=A0ABP1QV16_9HEXA